MNIAADSVIFLFSGSFAAFMSFTFVLSTAIFPTAKIIIYADTIILDVLDLNRFRQTCEPPSEKSSERYGVAFYPQKVTDSRD